MTWAEWIASDYNTDGYTILNDNIQIPGTGNYGGTFYVYDATEGELAAVDSEIIATNKYQRTERT